MPTRTDEYGERYLSCDKCGYGYKWLWDFGNEELCQEHAVKRIMEENPSFDECDAEYELEDNYRKIKEPDEEDWEL